MPSVFELTDTTDSEGGYCWRCHQYYDYSLVYKIWEGVGRDERDEFESGYCPGCGEKLDSDADCELCGERGDLFEYKKNDKETLLYCPFCYTIVKTKNLIDELEKEVNKDIEYELNIPETIMDYLSGEYDLPKEFSIATIGQKEQKEEK